MGWTPGRPQDVQRPGGQSWRAGGPSGHRSLHLDDKKWCKKMSRREHGRRRTLCFCGHIQLHKSKTLFFPCQITQKTHQPGQPSWPTQPPSVNNLTGKTQGFKFSGDTLTEKTQGSASAMFPPTHFLHHFLSSR